jgi:predicted acyltransferase
MSETASITNSSVADVTAPPVAAPARRFVAVDALRGFDMFWIIGADALVYALNRVAHGGGPSAKGFTITGLLADQLEHAEWAGFHFYDLIFPLFVFISGISVVFSLTKIIEREGRAAAMRRVLRRGVLLFIIALFYSGGFNQPWPHIRLLGVLNRIAICYFFAGMVFCYCSLRTMISICVALLVVYWALMTFVPIRDIQLSKANLAKLAAQTGISDPHVLFEQTAAKVTGKYEPGLNLSNHLDFQYLPGRLYDTYWDPEGLLSTLPAISSCLLGVFAGLLLLNPNFRDEQKVIYLIAAGIILANLGLLWGLQFPVIKKIWTSSFVLVAGGCSAVLLGLFYLVIEVLKFQKWCQPFVWMGMNSITIYLTSNILYTSDGGSFRRIARRFAGGDVQSFLDAHLVQGAGELTVAIIGLLLAFWFVHFLYRRKIFLRL